MSLLSKLLHFVLLTSSKYKIDESHSISHSMNVLHFTHNIFNSEVLKNKKLYSQEQLIYVSAVVHDMCDKKYMNEDQGIQEVATFLQKKINPTDIEVVKKIIGTMSYSKVKKNGFPDLGEYQNAYHIVREADLLSAYDFDRSIIYYIQKNECDINSAYKDSVNLFETRVFKHEEDGLFITDYSKNNYMTLQNNANIRIKSWKNLLKKPFL